MSVNPEMEAITERTVSAAFDLQTYLLQKFSLFLDERREDIKLIPTRAEGLEIDGNSVNRQRNLVLLGGPGGFPYVALLLEKWAQAAEDANRGYRFVTEPGRFTASRYVRGSRGPDDPLGIEDMVDGQRQEDNFIPLEQPTKETGPGRTCGVIYTQGFGEDSVSPRIIVLAPIDRYVIDGMVAFLMDAGNCNSWLEQVQSCGEYSETLLSFHYTYGKAAKFLNFAPPRPLAQLAFTPPAGESAD